MEPYWRLTWRSVWLAAIHVSLLVTSGYGLDPSRHISQYGHTLWRSQDTLLNAATPITQTTDGYIWITTENGLARFDGVNFVPWTPPRDIPFSWRHFSALLGASDGSLWIGTSSGLGRLKDGHFRSYSKPRDRWGIGSIIEDHAGHIWVTRYRVPHNEGAICEALDEGLRCYGPADGVPLPYATGLAEDSQGNFWIGSVYLCRWKPGSTCATYFNKGLASPEIYTATVASGPSQTVWAVANPPGRQGGLHSFSVGKWSPYSVPGFNGSTVESEAMLTDRDGSLWVGTETAGLYRIHNGVVDHYGPADGLSGHQVAQIYEDHEGNLWVTTEGGMDMFRNTPVIGYSVKEGLSSSNPDAILASRDGSIWIGAADGIDMLRDGRKQHLPAWPGPKHAAVSLLEDHTGTIWFSTSRYLAYWDRGHFHLFKPYNDDSHGREVNGLTEDGQHNLWAVTETYLFRFDQRQVQQYIPLPKGFVSRGLLAPDLQGGIWISDSASHMFRYSNGQFQTMELKDSGGANAGIQAMITDADDPLLVATLAGLFRWDGHSWSILDGRNGLPCTQLVSIVKDDHGALWVGSQCGLLRIDLPELAKWRRDAGAKVAVKVFDRLDGAYPAQKLRVEPYVSRAPDGRIWFANSFEVESFDPDHLFQNSVLPPVHIQRVIADEKSYEPSPAQRLPARTRNLEIDYTALSLSVPQKVRFRYKLEGHDTDWQNAGTRRQAFYTDIGPGSYTFHVIACNNDGVWNETGTTLDFNVTPAWYQTMWFRSSCVVAFVLLLWMVYQLRLSQLARQFNVRMEERTRIARELHDTLLQSLHGVMFQFQAGINMLHKSPAQAKQTLEDAIGGTEKAIAESQDAIEDLRSKQMAESDLAHLLTEMGNELARSQDANQDSPVFRVIVEGERRSLVPALQDEIYRVGREALRNAFRHASARQIEAEIRYDGHEFRLRIRDDGKGIAQEVLEEGKRAGHWGLPGIQERAQRIGGKLDVWSQAGAGTEVQVTVPAAIAYEKSRSRDRFRLFRRAKIHEQRS